MYRSVYRSGSLSSAGRWVRGGLSSLGPLVPLVLLVPFIAGAALGAAPAWTAAASSDAPTGQAQQPPTGQGQGALAWRAQQLLADANNYWSQQFMALGGHYPPATLMLFSAPLPGACNSPQPLTGSFYCPGDQEVYLDQVFQRRLAERTAGDDDAGLAFVIGHEVAHHVQELVGTTAVVEQARSRSTPAVSRLTWTSEELQADCYAGLWLGSAEKHGVLKVGDTAALLVAVGAVSHEQQEQLRGSVLMPDPILDYGTAAQRTKWFEHGLRGHGLADCDTFSAEAAGKL